MIDKTKRQAIESLIHDDDPRTRALLSHELSLSCEENYRLLKGLLDSPCPDVRRFACDVLERAGKVCECSKDSHVPSIDDFKRPYGWEHLESFCWWLVKEEFPDFDVCRGYDQFDAWAEQIDDVSPGCSGPHDRIKRLRKILAQGAGLRGDFCDYYSSDNTYLNRVIERKRGIPLTLSLIYIFIGRRVGWKMGGLNMPGHFLAHIEGVVFDPFFNGKILSAKELEDRYYLPASEFSDLEGFQAEPAEVARRILGNLYNSYFRNGQIEQLERVGEYLQVLSESA